MSQDDRLTPSEKFEDDAMVAIDMTLDALMRATKSLVDALEAGSVAAIGASVKRLSEEDPEAFRIVARELMRNFREVEGSVRTTVH